jgi:hypothetical protein
MSLLICSLFEAHYHFGLAALVNTLHRAGFRGSLVAGFRGSPPPWAPSEGWHAFGGLQLQLRRVETEAALTNFKPEFLGRLLEENPACDAIAYLDPDILVKAPWSYLEAGIRGGSAFVADAHAVQVSRHHPFRAAWKTIAQRAGLTVFEPALPYVNAGFIGLTRERALHLLPGWQRVLDLILQDCGDSRILHKGNLLDPFNYFDQDALNVALQCSDEPPAIWPCDAMDFGTQGSLLCHAAGGPKPWLRSYFKELIRRKRTRHYDGLYLDAWLAGPAYPYPKAYLRARKVLHAVFDTLSHPWKT